jgi:hypothetical protein
MPAGVAGFTVRGRNAGWLVVGAADIGLAWRRDALAVSRAILCIPEGDRQMGCLIAPGGIAFGADGDRPGAAVSLRLERDAGAGPVRFLHPLNPHWRLGTVPDAGGDAGAVKFARQGPSPSCEFLLEPSDVSAIDPAALALAQDIATGARVPARWQPLLADLREERVRPSLAEALLRCLPLDELADLAQHLASCPADLRLLRTAVRHDAWLADRFDALLTWRGKREVKRSGGQTVRIQDADDIPGATRATAHRPGLGHALHALARRGTQPRRMACVLGSARREGPYLLDWIAYHRSIGFGHVFLYTNDNDDGSDELLGRLARAGVVTWLRNEIAPGGLPQFRAYAHALSILPEILDYRWTLIADLDEYFAFDTELFASVADYLMWHDVRHADAVALPWLLHVAGRDDAWHDAPCPERFPWREETVNHHIKTIFRTNLYWSSNPHHPDSSLGMATCFRAQDGQPHVALAPERNPALAENPRATHAWIAHYIFKSAQELLMKHARGKGDSAAEARQVSLARYATPFMSLLNNVRLVQDARTLRCGAALGAERARLLAIPGVADADAAIKADFSARMTQACLQFVRQGDEAGEADACAALRGVLQRQRYNQLFAA